MMQTIHKSATKKNTAIGRPSLPISLTYIALAVAVILVMVMNYRNPISYAIFSTETISYEKGTVLAVTDESIEPADGMPGWDLGTQTLLVKMTSGVQQGEEIQMVNTLSTDHNVRVAVGQAVIIKADRPEGITPYYTIYNYDRTAGLCIVGALFVLFMVAVGRLKGLRSIGGLGISLFFIFGFLLPTIYHGYSPILMSILTAMVIAFFSLLLLNGFSRKTFTAVSATVAGALLSAGFFFLISALLQLSGYNMDGTEELILVSRGTGLQLGQVMFAGVLISSIGAVMDMTMSIASSLDEMKRIHPSLSWRELFSSGLAIGKDMIGTMCQTLVLAFVGSALPTLLVLISYGTQAGQFISSDYVAIEVVQSVAGSLAVISAVPITTGLYIMQAHREEKQTAPSKKIREPIASEHASL
ncbi:MAG: YibE/F family protein [Oscillospiraceae bacterium]|nr:YibE/F family protein [Oscillospiraceae bacterium]